MIVNYPAPRDLYEDDFKGLSELLEKNKEIVQDIIGCGENNNCRICIVIPMSSHSSARNSSLTPSMYVVMGRYTDGNISSFRPDGKRTAFLTNNTWKIIDECAWVEIDKIPTMEASTGTTLSLNPHIMRNGDALIYDSEFITQNFDNIVILDWYLDFHKSSIKLVRGLYPEYQSSFMKNLSEWFHKDLNIVKYVSENNSFVKMCEDDMLI